MLLYHLLNSASWLEKLAFDIRRREKTIDDKFISSGSRRHRTTGNNWHDGDLTTPILAVIQVKLRCMN